MSKLEKIYVTALPMTTEEYAVAHQHTVLTMTEAESAGGFQVEILENATMTHDVLGKVDKTHKIMHLRSMIPAMLRSIIPEDACVVEETSYNAYTRCHTVYKNRYFSSNTFSMVFNTINIDGADVLSNPFGYVPEHAGSIECINIDLHENIINPSFDPSIYYHEISGRGRLSAGWVDRYKSMAMPIMVSYKHLTVEVNNFAMGWVTGEIEKAMRRVVRSVQQRIFCTMDEWYGKTMEEIRALRRKDCC